MSRINKSIKNARVSMVLYMLTMFVGFFSRKVFIHYLGAEILGLNTLIVNLLNFLNLAELGIGAAVSFSLYKPLYEKQQETINEIVSVQGYLYRRVGWAIITCSIILLFFFPLIFEKAEVPLYDAYITFVVMLFSSALGYFVNYKQNLLEADQKQYVLVYCTYGIRLVKSLIQIIAVIYLPYPYLFWLGIEFVFAIIIAVSINRSVRKFYPCLEVSVPEGKMLLKKYEQIVVKIKQLFFHKLAGFAVYQSNPIIIYSFTTLTLVAIYGNYMLILNAVMLLINSIFNGINASIGNLIVESTDQKIKEVLWELMAIRMWIAAVLCYAILELSPAFMTLWVGKEYILDNVTVYLLLIYQFIQMTRITENFLYAYGQFKDVWAAVCEAVMHIGLAVLGGYLWGINGILAGCIVAVFLIGVIWKPIFLFKSSLPENVWRYFGIMIKNLAVLVLSAFVTHAVLLLTDIHAGTDMKYFIGYSILVTGEYMLISFSLFYLLSPEFRQITQRLVKKLNTSL